MERASQRLPLALLLPVERGPFVGREAALGTLRAGRRPVCVVLGEPGIGKSRLLAEARRAATAGSFQAVCLPGDAPLEPLLSLVRAMHRAGLVATATVGALVAAPAAAGLVREALEQAAAVRPLTLQIDDLDEADEATLRALRACIDRLQRLPVRWHLAAGGNGSSAALVDQLRHAQQADVIELDGLTREQSALVARALAGDHELDDAAILRLFERTAGNPLYLESILAQGEPDGEISAELRRSLALRLAALPADAAHVAGWVAVHGAVIALPLLRTLSAFSPARLRTALDALVEAHVLRTSEEGCGFRQGLLRDACYGALQDATRIAHHNAFEATTRDDGERAVHLDGACRVDEVVALYNQLGWERLERDEPQAARDAFGRAGERALPHSVQAYEALAGTAASAYRNGRHDEAFAAMAAFEAASGRLPERLLVLARSRFAELVWAGSEDHQRAAPVLEAALDQAARCAPEALPRLWCVLGEIYAHRGELERARDVIERGSAACDEAHDPAQAIRLQRARAVVEGQLGDAPAGIARLEAATRRAAALGLTTEVALCCAKLCDLYDLAPDPERQAQWCRSGLDAPGPSSSPAKALLLSRLAKLAIGNGRLREALGLSEAAVQALRASAASALCEALAVQAHAAALLGDFDGAAHLLREAAVLSPGPAAGRALAFSAAVASECRGDAAAALRCYGDAVVSGGDDRPRDVGQLRALTGIVRSACALGRPVEARAARDRLRAARLAGAAAARGLLQEADGYLSLLAGEPAKGCKELLLAAAADPDPVRRARLQLEVADVRRERRLFLEVIEAYDRLGCVHAAEAARRLARAHGLRPGRSLTSPNTLSAREASVARLVANGMTNNEIGKLLHITARTAEFHVGNILAKCGLRSRVEIASRIAAGTLPVE